MAFTDEDLKRLKDHLSDECYLSTEWIDARKLMPGLLSRLEAAEKVCHWDRMKGYPAFLLAKATWRKSKGA